MFVIITKTEVDWGETFFGCISSGKVFKPEACIRVNHLVPHLKWLMVSAPCFSGQHNDCNRHSAQSLYWFSISNSTLGSFLEERRPGGVIPRMLTGGTKFVIISPASKPSDPPKRGCPLSGSLFPRGCRGRMLTLPRRLTPVFKLSSRPRSALLFWERTRHLLTLDRFSRGQASS